MLDFIYSHLQLQTLMWLVVVFPMAGAAINGLFSIAAVGSESPRYRYLSSFVGCMAPLLSFVSCAVIYFTLTGFQAGEPSAITGPLYKWIAVPDISIDVGLGVDQLSLVFALLASFVGLAVHVYSIGYMWHDAGYPRYFALMNLSLFFILLVVLADNLILMYVGWVGMSLCACMATGFWFDKAENSSAALRIFLLNSAGDIFAIAGIFFVFGIMLAGGMSPEFGMFNFSMMEKYAAYYLPVASIVSMLFLTASATKLVQVPFCFWMPQSTVAPLPTAAFVHVASMAMAGSYLLIRLNFIFALSPLALKVMSVVGIATVIYAACAAIAETDFRRVIAYIAVGQAGYIFIAAGVGAFSSAAFHLVVFVITSTLIFLGAGSAIHSQGGECDIFKMGGLKRRMPVTGWTYFIGSLAFAGIFPLSGFFSKNSILWQAYERGNWVVWLFAFLGAGLLAFNVFRAAGAVFFGESNIPTEKLRKIVEAPISMVVSQMLLATGAVLVGLLAIPEIMGGTDHFAEWIGAIASNEMSRAPSMESKGAEIVLMVVSALWLAHFSILGWLIYSQKRDWPHRISSRMGPIYGIVANNFYLNEAFDFAVVRPIVWISENIVWKTLDRVVIDGIIVSGFSRVFGFVGMMASSAQNGVLQQYLLYFLIGAIIVVAYLAL